MAFFGFFVAADEVVGGAADAGDGFADGFPLFGEGAAFVVAADFVGAVPGAAAVELPFAAAGDGRADADAAAEVFGVVGGVGGGGEVLGAVEVADAGVELPVALAVDDFVAFVVAAAGGGECGDGGGGALAGEADGVVGAVEVVGVVGGAVVAAGVVVAGGPGFGADVVLVDGVGGVAPGDFAAGVDVGGAGEGGADAEAGGEVGGFAVGFAAVGVVGGAQDVAGGAVGVLRLDFGDGVAVGVGDGFVSGAVDVAVGGEGEFDVAVVFALPGWGGVFKGDEGPACGGVALELHDGVARGEDEQEGVDLQPGDAGEVVVVPGGVGGGFEGGDGECVAAAPDAQALRGEFDEVGLVCAVDVGDEARGGCVCFAEVEHAAAAADAAGGVDVPVGDAAAGAGVDVHVGAECHGGADFAAVECEALHGGGGG